ncbi:MAG: ABC transporter ATP-binding protein/permease [Bacteroidales bacterium]|nr:ABC transporter ATP-binding protein/permease [Bacteroidales bacterium]
MNAHSPYYLFRTLRLIWSCSPAWSLVNALLVIVRGFIPLAQLWAVKVIIDITTQQVLNHEFVFSEVLYGLLLMASLFVANSVATSLHSIVKERHSYRLADVVSSIIHHKTTTVGYGFFEDANYHNVFYRAVAESSSKPQAVFYNVVSLIQQCLTIGSLAVVLYAIHWSLPFVILLLGLPIVVVRISFSRRYYALQREQTVDERKVQYYNRVLTAREFAKEVRVFSLADHFRNLYCVTLDSLRGRRISLLVRSSVVESLIQLLASLMFVGVFGFVMWRAVALQMTVGSLAMYLMVLQRSYGTAQDLLVRIASLYDSNLFLKNFFDFIDMPTDAMSPAKTSASHASSSVGHIEFRDVSFSYPNSERTVLSRVSFTINRGETIAVVGRNGCGKSTIIKLICGLYQPSSGEVDVNGKISAIFQDFMLYNASARDNIRFGNFAGTASDDEVDVRVQRAATNAGLDKLINSLPGGYQTQLGNLTPQSEMLSQGEWQRVALSRSFYADSDIIVLDEPTSSLDAFTEASLTEHFRAITLGRTAIIVSHRLSSIKMADRIIVVDNHTIAECGTYSELVSRGGLFAEMISKLED